MSLRHGEKAQQRKGGEKFFHAPIICTITPRAIVSAPGYAVQRCLYLFWIMLGWLRVSQMQAQCGNLPFLIRKDGTWLYRGSPIRRKEMLCLFSSLLTRDAEGDYWLETPSERGRIEVEDVPWLAVELGWCGAGPDQCLTLRTNVDQVITVDGDHPIRVSFGAAGDPVPYVLVRPGLGGKPLEARISRPVYYELAALSEPHCVGGRRMLGVRSRGCFFALGEDQ